MLWFAQWSASRQCRGRRLATAVGSISVTGVSASRARTARHASIGKRCATREDLLLEHLFGGARPPESDMATIRQVFQWTAFTRIYRFVWRNYAGSGLMDIKPAASCGPTESGHGSSMSMARTCAATSGPTWWCGCAGVTGMHAAASSSRTRAAEGL
jgi:hypothetical protein